MLSPTRLLVARHTSLTPTEQQLTMIVMIILGVLVLCFAGVAFMVSKNWRWTHVTLLVGVFFAAIGCMVLAAIVLQTQANWRQVHNKLAAQLADTESRLQDLQVANVLNAEPESVPRLQGDLNRMIIDRGRVWRNVIPELTASGRCI